MSDDRQLLAGIAGRDPEAFQTLMERYAGPVTHLALRLLESRPDAEEAAQEVFLRLYQNPPRLHPEVKLFTWLYRVTLNRCLDLLRRRSRAPQPVSLDAPVGPAEEEPLVERLPQPAGDNPREQLVRLELAAVTRRAVAALPEALRVPLVLSTFEELSHDAIAEILGLSPKAVERRLSRARELLKSRLQPYL